MGVCIMLIMTNDQLDKLCENVGAELSPHGFMAMADAIKAIKPDFNKEKFISRCTIAWEDKYLKHLDDEVPY